MNNKEKIWIFGIYLRVSHQDKQNNNSIDNQQKIIYQYLKKIPNSIIYDNYIDNGYSGTTFNRPNFFKMVNNIKEKKINAIIVKDLSRLGRNYLYSGIFLEEFLPLNNIRFISVNDNIDSLTSKTCDLDIVIRNLLNEEYSKDISIKVKTSLNANKKLGKYLSGNAPYGYRINPSNKHQLIIDTNVSKNVKYIFDLYIQGNSIKMITDILNNKNLLTPAYYKKLTKINKWSLNTVHNILTNQVYCGDLLQCKTSTISYKNAKEIKNPREKWIISENTHEAIITRDEFKKVQVILKNKRKNNKQNFHDKNKLKIACYLRISQKEKKQIESNSIINQKKIIQKFLYCLPNIFYVKYYIDDGYSGANFNRPAFQKMINDMKKGKINTIVVKDLSRLGRNYLQVGTFLDKINLENNFFFISINDHINNYRDKKILYDISIAIKNLFNDYYLKDISTKIITSLDIKRKKGLYIGSIPPYGYIKNKENKNILEIDFNASTIIKKIFSLADQGYSLSYISKYLNSLNILTPYSYKVKILKLNIDNRWHNIDTKWTPSAIRRILNNPIYCGHLVQAKTRKINYKMNKERKTKKNEQIVCYNTHEAIIDNQLFETIQKEYLKKVRVNKL